MVSSVEAGITVPKSSNARAICFADSPVSGSLGSPCPLVVFVILVFMNFVGVLLTGRGTASYINRRAAQGKVVSEEQGDEFPQPL